MTVTRHIKSGNLAVDEPVAAACGYTYQELATGELEDLAKYRKTFLVFDFGGRTFDSSVVLAEPPFKFTVIAQNGNFNFIIVIYNFISITVNRNKLYIHF